MAATLASGGLVLAWSFTLGSVPATPSPPTTPVPGASLKTVNVASIAALKSALADNTVDVIIVANGTYHVSNAASQRSDSLWIGAAYAGRTRPVTVRAQTRGGVTFDGGGTTSYGCISFEEGAHDQTWDGFNCANGQATDTGVVTFGVGYDGLAAPYNITMRFIAILASCTGRATTASSPALDHAFYIEQAVGGPHDLLFEDITVDGSGGLASAFQFYHSDASNPNAWNVTVRRLHVTKTQQAILLYDSTLRNIVIDTADITGALSTAVTYEHPGTNIVIENVVSTGSGQMGFYSSLGPYPPGLTFLNDSLH